MTSKPEQYDEIRAHLAPMVRGESKSFSYLHFRVQVEFNTFGLFKIEVFPVDEPNLADYKQTKSLKEAVAFILC